MGGRRPLSQDGDDEDQLHDEPGVQCAKDAAVALPSRRSPAVWGQQALSEGGVGWTNIILPFPLHAPALALALRAVLTRCCPRHVLLPRPARRRAHVRRGHS